MTSIKITQVEWETLKLKLTRKYISLVDSDLEYVEGGEEELVTRLAKRLNRSRDYVIFTLSKQLSDLTSNRL